MIRVHRIPAEPPALAAARATKLAELERKVAARERLLDVGRPTWRPQRRNQSVRGAYTIRVLRLDRDSLIEEYNRHVKKWIEPLMKPIQDALRRQDKQALWNAFHRAKGQIFGSDEPFLGLAHDAVRFFVPDADLARVSRQLRWPTPEEIPLRRRTDR